MPAPKSTAQDALLRRLQALEQGNARLQAEVRELKASVEFAGGPHGP